MGWVSKSFDGSQQKIYRVDTGPQLGFQIGPCLPALTRAWRPRQASYAPRGLPCTPHTRSSLSLGTVLPLTTDYCLKPCSNPRLRKKKNRATHRDETRDGEPPHAPHSCSPFSRNRKPPSPRQTVCGGGETISLEIHGAARAVAAPVSPSGSG